jgi:hypothetical protein
VSAAPANHLREVSTIDSPCLRCVPAQPQIGPPAVGILTG